MIWKQFLYNFMVLLNGPVKDALFCSMDRYRNVLRLVHGKELPVPKGWNSLLPTWVPQVTIARNCRFPEVATPGSQPGNHGLPLQGTAGSHEVGTHGSQPGDQRLPLQATGSQRLELMLPNLGTIGYHCKELPIPKGWNWWFPPGNHSLPWQGTAGSQTLKLTVPNLGTRGCHWKELPVPRS